MQHYSRNLQSNPVVEEFLKRALSFDYTKYKNIVPMIVDAEMGVEKFNEKFQTLNSDTMRVEKYRSNEKRDLLQRQIITELFSSKQLGDDDDIKLKRGGALPMTKVKSNKQAFILIGLPAAGKSTIAKRISRDYGAVIVDSDFAKRKLPEYNNHSYGASLVHEESSAITFGLGAATDSAKPLSLYELCLKKNYNIVIPRIGQSPNSIIQQANVLGLKGYKVHLILVSLSKRDSTVRAAIRYHYSNRYVPLGLIFDGYGNDPSLCYYFLRGKYSDLFKSLGAISTLNKQPKQTDIVGNSPIKIYKKISLNLPLI